MGAMEKTLRRQKAEGINNHENIFFPVPSPVPSPQSPIPNPQSPIPNPQSPVPNPQSPVPSPQTSLFFDNF
ncbi:hypothetical protein Cal7507_1087 [Calothrix sp. PCC 7507]|nr:hypothetical protein Cal7507_1087 [Calothrix sp. PCC 7507]